MRRTGIEKQWEAEGEAQVEAGRVTPGEMHERGDELNLQGGIERMEEPSPGRGLYEQRPGEKTDSGIFRGC